jgi:integrase
MAVTKRGKVFHILFRPFDDKLVGIRTFSKCKTEARLIERAILCACRSGDYSALDPVSRELCLRMFINQGKKIPAGLAPQRPVEDLTLWEAAEIFLKYPGISDAKVRDRYEIALTNLAEYFGREFSIRSMRVPDVKRYMFDRIKRGTAEGTVNREKGTLSKLFQILIELEMVEQNPCERIKNLSEKSGQREVYLSFQDVRRILEVIPDWFKPIVYTAYCTGMRRGEILGLTRSQVNLKRRLIVLSAGDTKEGHPKRVPIHMDLLPTLREAMKVRLLDEDKVFLIKDAAEVRPPSDESTKNPWRKAMKKLGLTDPRPRFHDLRHTWKTNARRSGVDFEIRESIMGHSSRQKSVAERYGRISDEELIEAADKMTFDHGDTEILVARKGGRVPSEKNVNRALTNTVEKRKGRAGTRPNSLKLLVGGRGFEPPTPAV